MVIIRHYIVYESLKLVISSKERTGNAVSWRRKNIVGIMLQFGDEG